MENFLRIVFERGVFKIFGLKIIFGFILGIYKVVSEVRKFIFIVDLFVFGFSVESVRRGV